MGSEMCIRDRFSEESIPDEWIDVSAKESEEYKSRNDKRKMELE